MNRLIIADIRSMNINGKAVGHYFSVATNFIEMFQDCCEVLVAGGPLYRSKYNNLVLLDYDSHEERFPLQNKKYVLHNIRQLFQKCNGDTIVLQSSAVATAYIGIALFKPKNIKLYMIQYNMFGLDSYIKKFLYSLIKKKLDGIICPQDRIGEAYGKPFCIVPDYIYTGVESKNEIPYQKKKYDFGMVGIISRDKGILEVAKRLKNTRYKVLIAGHPQTDEIRNELNIICKDAGNIELKMEYLSEETYQQNINESRYCILNYSGAYSDQSSGVVFDIIFRGVPVIGSDCISMSFVKENKLGEIINDITIWNPDNALDENKYDIYKENIKQYYKTHKAHREKLKKFLGL